MEDILHEDGECLGKSTQHEKTGLSSFTTDSQRQMLTRQDYSRPPPTD